MKKIAAKLCFFFSFITFLLNSSAVKAQETSVQGISKQVSVKAQPLKEENPVGPYKQPEWTTARRFPTTRVYLQQLPWNLGVEQWVKAQVPRGEPSNYLFQEEIEIGLPYRFQLDLYENWIIDGDSKVRHDSFSTELRWAFAEWGKIPLNPAIYFEWKFQNGDLGADRFEIKVLLGGEIIPNWHWGSNLFYEHEIGAMHTRELGATAAVSYTLIDEKLGLGTEIKVESATEDGNRSPIPVEVDLGPSFQWKPTDKIHFDLLPLIGVTKDSPRVEIWIVVGFDFGGKGEKGPIEPVSTKSQ